MIHYLGARGWVDDIMMSGGDPLSWGTGGSSQCILTQCEPECWWLPASQKMEEPDVKVTFLE